MSFITVIYIRYTLNIIFMYCLNEDLKKKCIVT